MLNPHPLSRASLEEIKSHPWMQQPRHLTRHPAKSFLSGTHTKSQDRTSLHHTELEHRSHHQSSEREQTTTYPIVERKNSSGYFSSCASELSSSSNPPSPTRAHWLLFSIRLVLYHFQTICVSVWSVCAYVYVLYIVCITETVFSSESQFYSLLISPFLLLNRINIYTLFWNNSCKVCTRSVKNIYHVSRLCVNWQSVFCSAEWSLTTPAIAMSSKLGLFLRAGSS